MAAARVLCWLAVHVLIIARGISSSTESLWPTRLLIGPALLGSLALAIFEVERLCKANGQSSQWLPIAIGILAWGMSLAILFTIAVALTPFMLPDWADWHRSRLDFWLTFLTL